MKWPARPGKTMRSISFAAALLALLTGCNRESGFDLDRTLAQRPTERKMVFDYVGLLREVQPSVERQLAAIRDRYQIEVLIVALPALENRYTVTEAAVRLFSNWRIGQAFQGRGILLLLVDDIKTVKLEVGYALEDVFTDLFTGHIQDMQLQPYFASGRLDIGLIATLEEIEARSQIKFQGRYSPTAVAALDARYLSQGAGARHVLEDPQKPVPSNGRLIAAYPAGNTPESAWQTMRQHWQDRVRDPNLGVYTAVTRLTYRDYTHLPDDRFDEDYRRYAGKPFEVRQSGNFAVIYFGSVKGWENSPFFFCRTSEGWQFDIVHQRRFVRMGRAPDWGIEFSEHPYMGLLMDAFQFNGQDVPLTGEDLYTTEKDAWWAEEILARETQQHADADDAEAILALGRLYALVSMSRKAIPLLTSAQSRLPRDSRPCKYLAIAWVDAYYQYDKALKALDACIALAPEDPFAHQFRGYVNYCRQAYDAAVSDLEAALRLNPDDGYAHFYLTCAYAGLHRKAVPLDPRRRRYKERFTHHFQRIRAMADQHPLRLAWLNRAYPEASTRDGR